MTTNVESGGKKLVKPNKER